ncbi:hypothetical protein BJV82DRAFT_668480 [Fennellomyces sp. T-0311]|nr:hypothetical protein BJV82DRAFT_668480 [Fennellomyces sp. T-0311]
MLPEIKRRHRQRCSSRSQRCRERINSSPASWTQRLTQPSKYGCLAERTRSIPKTTASTQPAPETKRRHRQRCSSRSQRCRERINSSPASWTQRLTQPSKYGCLVERTRSIPKTTASTQPAPETKRRHRQRCSSRSQRCRERINSSPASWTQRLTQPSKYGCLVERTRSIPKTTASTQPAPETKRRHRQRCSSRSQRCRERINSSPASWTQRLTQPSKYGCLVERTRSIPKTTASTQPEPETKRRHRQRCSSRSQRCRERINSSPASWTQRLTQPSKYGCLVERTRSIPKTTASTQPERPSVGTVNDAAADHRDAGSVSIAHPPAGPSA